MAKPDTQEYDIVLEQQARLQNILVGPDWNTSIGATVLIHDTQDYEPAERIALIAVATNPESVDLAMCTVIWRAHVDVSDGGVTALQALADMRAALVSQCPHGETMESGVTLTLAPPGTNWAKIDYSTQTTILLEGRHNG